MIGETKKYGNIKEAIIQQLILNTLKIDLNYLLKMVMVGGGTKAE